MEKMRTLHTIGHSNMAQDEFIRILEVRGIEAIADVRSTPHSRHVPWFNRETLTLALNARGIRYVHLGDQLGGRPGRDDLYGANGRADYERMAWEPSFQQGLERLEQLADEMSVAMMCTEHDHLACHRTLMVARALSDRRNRVVHIMRDGRQERHCEAMSRLMRIWNLPGLRSGGLTRTDLLAQAILAQAQQVAYQKRG